MKSLAIRALFLITAAAGLAFAPAAQAQVEVNVTIGGFYDELAPYGRWVDCSYGQCWVPERVAADWQPYSNGQWIYTDYGWTWVSEDPWGGSPYHYGTWTSIQGYGWSWVPGTVWAPAWVTWSYSNDYVGWAPLPPTVAFGASGYSGSPVVVARTQYVFVPTNRFVGRNVATIRVPSGRVAQIFQQTRPVTSFAVSGGIVRNNALPMATIERAGGKIETKSIGTARTAPRAMPAGTSHLSVVAPARELKAAAAARPATASRAPEPARDEKHASRAPGHEAKAPADVRQPVSRSSDASQANKRPKASADSRTQSEKERKAPEAPPMESHRPEAQAPAEHRHEPAPRADSDRPAPKPKSKPAEREKPEEKDQKPDGGNP